MTAYEILMDFQNAIVGVLGFGIGFTGVILTLRSNARLAREQQSQNVELALAEHARDIELRRRVVRKGILAEFRLISSRMELNLKAASGIEPNESSFAQLAPKLGLTHELVREVGLLSDAEIAAVISVTESLSSIADILRRNDISGTPSETTVVMTAKFADGMVEMSGTTLELLESAIQKLELGDEANTERSAKE